MRELLEDAWSVFPIDVVGKPLAEELCRWIATLGFDRRADVGEHPLGIRRIDHIIDVFDQMTILLL